ncbi:hypothetical protein FT663_04412 [Candidozyma haemuli var. vulneris]|uniref:DUF726-domain-containing protein n=1 Tax=Candidozyma haemuli TaxID=45357 RepID=A0A2V1AYC3_9ASCO|nr:hypothetical protein CXQ85_002827 [[Candida] haemuloni]KAF3987535.1 hypothetical protein FT663_04412 [[Candida] haemuloni var. vulneris]KAF3990998.1 hypothetical protein FT662_01934 [[Candida] haemuloni var. vulneris]PVH23100.1 hypothetical protein CXQ85_002827 [[Candida] haemuloni]
MSEETGPERFQLPRTFSKNNSREFNSRIGVGELPALPALEAESKNDPTEISSLRPPRTPQSQFVEFNLSSGSPEPHIVSSDDLTRNPEHKEADAADELSDKEEEEEPQAKPEEDFFSSNTDGWKSMKKVAKQDYYDDRGNLEFTRDNEFESLEHRDARGYTKIDTEEQLNKYARLDEKTNFLFELQGSRDKTAEDEDDETFDYGDEGIDSKETLAGTRGLLTESQKFAYIGMVKLITVDQAASLAKLNQRTTFRMSKPMGLAQKNFANWTKYIMNKLEEHLDINKQEKNMIDNLSTHGVQVEDLSQSLLMLETQKPIVNKLSKDFDLRWVLVCDLFLLLLSDGYFDSRSRTLFIIFANYLGILNIEVYQFERRLIESLEMDTGQKSIENRDDKLSDRSFIDKHIQKNKRKRLAYIGMATIGGSLAIGLSAGLLAPLIGAGLAAGLTTVGIGGTGGFLAGVGGSAIITTGGVAAGAKMGSKAGARRTGDVQTFELKPLHNNKRTNLIITVSGWMNGDLDDVRLPFSTVDPVMGDMFSLLWEPEMLRSMGQTIGILATEALSTSIQQILGATILSALMSAIQLPMALSKLSYLLDNPWNVSLDRAWKAGKILADTLMSGNMGVRPITLVGFSLGSRLIYSCLIELAQRGGYGLVENVILLGNPVAVKYEQITLARSVVSGKFVNGYSKNDWILGYLFRATGGGLSTVAGLSPIENIPDVENFDCTELVEGHMSYRKAVPKILRLMNWEVLSDEFAEIEEPDPEQGERQRQLISEFDEARAKMEKEKIEEASKEQKSWKSWFKPKQKNWWGVYDEAAKQEEDKNGNGEFEEYEEGTGGTTGTQRRQEQEQEQQRAEAIFDVSALAEEINDIEKISEQDPEQLKKVRQEVDPNHKELKMNEDVELEKEPPTSVFQNLKTKIPNPLNKEKKQEEA